MEVQTRGSCFLGIFFGASTQCFLFAIKLEIQIAVLEILNKFIVEIRNIGFYEVNCQFIVVCALFHPLHGRIFTTLVVLSLQHFYQDADTLAPLLPGIDSPLRTLIKMCIFLKFELLTC